VKLKNKNIQK